MMNRRYVLIGSASLVLVLAAFSIYFCTRPSLAFEQLRDAVVRQDRVAMERHIDFPSLRESIKLKLRQELSPSANSRQSPMAVLGAIAAEYVAGRVIDLAVSPEGIAAILSGSRIREITKPPPAEPSTSEAPPPGGGEVSKLEYRTQWDGISSYVVNANRDGKPVVKLVLRRTGLFEWRLAEIR